MEGLLDEAERRPDRLAQSQVRNHSREYTLVVVFVRIAAEHNGR